MTDVSLTRLEWKPVELEKLLNGPNGAVAKDLARRAIRVEAAAKMNASGPPGPNVRTGRLRNSITWRLMMAPDGLHAIVGSNVHYAPYVELGTSRMRARPFLRPALEAARD